MRIRVFFCAGKMAAQHRLAHIRQRSERLFNDPNYAHNGHVRVSVSTRFMATAV